ncbi:MAG: VWA domain-containing protein [Planctomycetales bacterium]|nr:VWA domain-containing protein [Planctomycetales bacterium]
MIDTTSVRLAQPLLAVASERTYFDLARLQTLDQWWHWLLLVGIAISLLWFVVAVYRRDSVELPRPTALLLTFLRLLPFVGLLIFYMQLEKRTEQRKTNNSRVVVMVDTSQSMGLTDREIGDESDSRVSRLDRVATALTQTPLLAALKQSHDVSVYRFDQESRPTELAAWSKEGPPVTADGAEPEALSAPAILAETRWLYQIAGALLAVALLASGLHFFWGQRVRGAEGESWALLVAAVVGITGLVFGAVANLRHPEVGWAELTGRQPFNLNVSQTDDAEAEADAEQVRDVNWSEALRARGLETRLGDALAYVVDKERGGPIAAVVVMTDGNLNSGVDVSAVVQAADAARIPVYPVGVGSDRRPQNLKIVDVEAPPRVFPGDGFSLTGYLQSSGFQGKVVDVSLESYIPAGGDTQPSATVVEQRRVTLGEDGEVIPLRFELTPEEIGERTYVLKVTELTEEIDKTDNQREATVKFVDRKTRVLLLAGGPLREYRFVRNLLFRDPQVTVDVLLQSSPSGAAQEADAILDDFPETAEEMFEYDCVIAFDPNWEALDMGDVELLERWVEESAGGLVFVSGAVYTPEWSGRRRSTPTIDLVRGLCPVTFYSASSLLTSRDRYSAESAWPLEFTEEGLKARFLRLDDDERTSREAWQRFEGVYGHTSVRGPKPAATVYARFSDPDSRIDDELPVYMAGQFYGAGRVFFMGSGEMWRLRSLDETYFETFYTKLLRFVSEGRLLRNSSRGVLLVSKDRCTLGESILVQAVLQDAQHRPLTATTVEASLIDPAGLRRPLTLKQIQDASQAGTYTSQFVAEQDGDYRIELPLPQGDGLEVLEREVMVRVPELEVENPQRNDALLSRLATDTGGFYYVGLDALQGTTEQTDLASAIAPADQITFLPSTPDPEFERRLMSWLMALICGALCSEWLIRRLNRLA